MAQQDLGYKRLFAHREMVADLLTGFVREPWVAEVELDTLERVSGSYVSDDLRERADDIIWRVRWRGGWLYVYLLLEFQASVDRFMALRMLVYVGLLYQDLIRAGQLTPAGRLPPVLPLVLYSGDDAWTATREVGELAETVSGGLDQYRPQMQYLLLEERRYPEADLASMQNLVAALFRLENSRGPDDVFQVVESLVKCRRHPSRLISAEHWPHGCGVRCCPGGCPVSRYPRSKAYRRREACWRNVSKTGRSNGEKKGSRLGKPRCCADNWSSSSASWTQRRNAVLPPPIAINFSAGRNAS